MHDVDVIDWHEGITKRISTHTNRVYRWDLTDWLDGATVASAEVVAPTGITAAVEGAVGSTYVDVRVSGAALGARYIVKVRATSTDANQADGWPVTFEVFPA